MSEPVSAKIQAAASGQNPVQPKVKWAAVGAYAGTLVVVAILQGVQDLNLIRGLPPLLNVFLVPLLPAAISFFTGYAKRNKPAA